VIKINQLEVWWKIKLSGPNYILNSVPQKDSNVTVNEHWKSRTLNIHFFKVWGCLAKILIPEPKKRKISFKTIDVVFIRYALGSNVNRFLVVNSDISKISKNTIIEGKDVYFEDIFPFKSRVPSDLSCNLSTSDIPSSSFAPPTEPRGSKKIKTQKFQRRFLYLSYWMWS